MHELRHKAEKELEKIADQGFTTSNLEIAYKLVDIVKDIYEIDEKKGSEGTYGRYPYMGYRDDRDKYDREPLVKHGTNTRLDRSIDRIKEGADGYWYGREKYMAGGNKEQMNEALEDMMYAVCSLIESGMDIAETPEEKEIIRKHIRKLQNL